MEANRRSYCLASSAGDVHLALDLTFESDTGSGSSVAFGTVRTPNCADRDSPTDQLGPDLANSRYCHSSLDCDSDAASKVCLGMALAVSAAAAAWLVLGSTACRSAAVRTNCASPAAGSSPGRSMWRSCRGCPRRSNRRTEVDAWPVTNTAAEAVADRSARVSESAAVANCRSLPGNSQVDRWCADSDSASEAGWAL